MSRTKRTVAQRMRRFWLSFALLSVAFYALILVGAYYVALFGLRATWSWIPGVLTFAWIFVAQAVYVGKFIKVKRIVTAARGLACPYCLYDVGHQETPVGNCPECGEPYSLDEVRRIWGPWSTSGW